jgi:hypothetical protein
VTIARDTAKRLRLLGTVLATVGALGTLALGAAPGAQAATPPPAWRIDSVSDTTVEAGQQLLYALQFTNVGGTVGGSQLQCSASKPCTLQISLPAGMTALSFPNAIVPECTNLGVPGPVVLTCTRIAGTGQLLPHRTQQPVLTVQVDPAAEGPLTTSFAMYGGKDSTEVAATRADGSPCSPAPPGTPCATTVDPVQVSAALPGFGYDAFDAQVSANALGDPFTQAGGHPYAVTVSPDFNTATDPNPFKGPAWPVEPIKDVPVELPAGLLGAPAKVPTCTASELVGQHSGATPRPLCPSASQIGTILVRQSSIGSFGAINVLGPIPIFNMVPPSGMPARFGFNISGSVFNLDTTVRSDGDYGITIGPRNIDEAVPVAGSTVTFWGVPADPRHDGERACPGAAEPFDPNQPGPSCSSGSSPIPFLRSPTSCAEEEGVGDPFTAHIDSWANPGAKNAEGWPELSDPAWKSRTIFTHQLPAYPNAPSEWGAQQGENGCADVPVKGELAKAQPTSQDAETPTGLNVKLEIPNQGFSNPNGIASSDIKAVKFTLPAGMGINPSQGEGLGVCTPAQFQSEQLSFFPDPGTGCPGDSKIGTVVAHTPLLSEALEGAIYVAKPFENPFNSLIALYIVIKNPERGVIVKLAGKVEADKDTGQLVTTFSDIPQQPFEDFEVSLREGVRSPLATPRTCGKYTAEAEFTPWSNPSHTISKESSFEITHGVGGGPCPTGGAGPFNPQLRAGTLNNNALSFSPFSLRMSREDGEQEITNFSADLPPGLAGKLAGIPKCSEADLAATAKDSGVNEINSSICPRASQVGRVTAGYGVGSVLSHATGRVFLAGPYHGTPVSVATVVPAVVGPFDLGTVVQRSAFRVDPETAQVHVDSKGSDPIPHILGGIPLHLRDVRVYLDRGEFTFNPTNCDPMKVGAFLKGSGADFASAADDITVDVSNPFQVSNCALLPFKPKLAFKLKGGTHRSDHPALTATLRGRPGDANIGKAVVALPHSEFLDQSHIGTVCTRVQFAADECPPASVYGHVTATTPLLDHPLEGNVYLRSSSNLLPDLVFALRGEINVDAVGRIDSFHQGIRTSFDTVPDTPVTKLVLQMQGAKKGLFENSTNLCRKTSRADVRFTGQNGKAEHLRPKMRNSCKRTGPKKHKRH